jgi:two-component system, OmpR family, sensor histidine kinase CiaH
MSIFKKKSLIIATVVYWFLLVYITSALVWWFIAIQTKTHQMAVYKIMALTAGDPAYLQKSKEITEEEKRKQAAYIGEGATFLLVILIGAVFVYRAVRHQLTMTHQQQNFMMAITHELKTPIAVAKLNLETLQKHKLEEGLQQKLIQTSLQEVNRLNTLTNNILISSQLEGGGYELSKEELDFSSLVNTCIQEFHNRFPDRKINAAITAEVDLTGDALLLQIMVNNLLENAAKYAPKETIINVTVSKTNHQAILEVADEGAGIADNEKKKVFDRFYRIGNEQVRRTTGTGLGLYLCKKIAADHVADILVTNNSPRGSIFAVHFKI